MKKKTLAILAAAWLILLSAGAGVAVTLAILGHNGVPAAGGSGYTVTEEEYRLLEEYRTLSEIYSLMKDSYVDEVEDQTLIDGAARGMLDSAGDRYTFFYTASEMADMEAANEGLYEGVGLQISLDEEEGALRVTRVFKNTPAYRAGVRAGDTLISVNDIALESRTDKDLSEAVSLIQNDEDGLVTLDLARDGEEYRVHVERTRVNINRVEYAMLDGNVGYILIYEFKGDAAEGFKKAVAELKKQGMEKLVLDLRSNPGGSLDLVVSIADELLPEGVILEIVDRAGNKSTCYSKAGSLGLPLAVLVNGHSASAAEVLAAAVQDHGVGVLVGETTFGKGIVQTVFDFEDGSGMQMTTARYYTPSGRYIHEVGIEPDIKVASQSGFDPVSPDPDPENDVQLRSALEELNRK